MYETDDFPMPVMDPECNTPVSDTEMRGNDENYWDCPGCGDPNFYMGDPCCGKCGWNGH